MRSRWQRGDRLEGTDRCSAAGQNRRSHHHRNPLAPAHRKIAGECGNPPPDHERRDSSERLTPMAIKRREFLRSVGTGAMAAGLYVPGVSAMTSGAPASPGMPGEPGPQAEGEVSQKLHADYCSDIPGGEYYLLGNGLIQAVLQTVPEGNPETHCGLLIMSPEHFGRKVSTFLYHPERGLERTRLTVIVDGTAHVPEFKTTVVSWKYPDQIPTLV